MSRWYWLIPIAAAALGLVGSIICWFKAMRFLTAQGEDRWLTVMILGIAAPRENFKPEGWRYRQRAIAFLLFPVATIFIVAFIDGFF